MKITQLLIATAAISLMAACKQAPTPVEAPAPDTQITMSEESFSDPDPATVSEPSYFDQKAEAGTRKAATTRNATGTKAAKSPANSKAETIYVETDGAQGRVWGHVTMKGDRGTGTIHDWDENTLTVTVTRHGNELFAVDQNSRQYVFKLKQNKTQE